MSIASFESVNSTYLPSFYIYNIFYSIHLRCMQVLPLVGTPHVINKKKGER
jgi:hypothetical protein